MPDSTLKDPNKLLSLFPKATTKDTKNGPTYKEWSIRKHTFNWDEGWEYLRGTETFLLV